MYLCSFCLLMCSPSVTQASVKHLLYMRCWGHKDNNRMTPALQEMTLDWCWEGIKEVKTLNVNSGYSLSAGQLTALGFSGFFSVKWRDWIRICKHMVPYDLRASKHRAKHFTNIPFDPQNSERLMSLLFTFYRCGNWVRDVPKVTELISIGSRTQVFLTLGPALTHWAI